LRYCNCYFRISPHIHSSEIETDILDWAERQMRETENCTAIDTPCRDTDSERVALLERHGFVRQETQTLYMTRPLSEPIPPAIFPEGFILRQVAGEQELDAIVALHQEAFGTHNMTIETRRAIMRNPDYIPELDLLLQVPDSTLAAFCYCTIPREANELSGRKEGEIAIIGTRPTYQKQGLGRAMLLAGLQRLKDFGVETATLGTSSENTSAHSVFFSAGFRISYRSLWHSKGIQ
jgi:mycothiol synthase